MPAPEINDATLEKFGSVKKNKHFTNIVDGNKKKACISKNKVCLQDYDEAYGTGDHVEIFSAEDIKKRHLGKVKCIIKFTSEEDLSTILEKYFG